MENHCSQTTPPQKQLSDDFILRLSEFISGRATWAQVENWDVDKMYGFARKGYSLMCAGRWDESRAIFEGLEALNPLDWYFPYCLAIIGRAQSRHDHAHKCLDRAIHNAAESPEPFLCKASWLVEENDYVEARTWLRRAKDRVADGSKSTDRAIRALSRHLAGRVPR